MTKKLQQKLLNVSNLDPCINAKLRSNLLIDLLSFINPKDLEKFLWGHSEKISLEKNDFSWIKQQLDNANDEQQFIDICFNNDINLNKSTIHALEKDYKQAKLKVINDIFKKQYSTSKLFHRFQLNASQIEREENIYPLYIASCFVNGYDVDQNPINAPLLLWEVSIKIENGTVYIIKNDSSPVVNEKINFYFDYVYGTKLSDMKFDSIKDIEKYQKYLKHIVNIDFNQPFEKFVNCDPKTSKQINFINCCVLAIMEPLGGVIKKDLEIITKKGEDPFAPNRELIDYKQISEKALKNDELIEINRPLNLYQKFAINSSLVRNTLIYGPPGTGKSETIASLIANIIYENKQVLMVSEKMAALEVLEKRLGNLANISLFAFKPEHKDKFYDALLQLDKVLKNDVRDVEHEIKQNTKKINECYHQLVDKFKSYFKINETLNQTYNINKYIYELPAIQKLEFTKIEFEWFQRLIKYFSNPEQLYDAYNQLISLNELISQHHDVVELLSKYNFNTNLDELKSFLNYFNDHYHETWLLKNFIKNKKDYKKQPLIKSNLKNEISIIKFFEEVVKQEAINEINFENINFLFDWPKSIKDESTYRQYLVFFLIQQAIKRNNEIDGMDQLIHQYYELHHQIAYANDALILNNYLFHLKQKINKNKKIIIQINKLIGYANSKKRPNINYLIKEHYDTLRFLFPIWILSPNQTCILTPCQKAIFDYGIFDEASQMFVERSFPLLYRCKINIVAGDDKQLQPSSFFMKQFNYDDQEAELEQLNLGTSLFEQAGIAVWAKFHLKNHYRSDASELIEFSNKYIYDNQLDYSNKNIHINQPLEIHEVNGIWQYQYNEVEIDEVINILRKNNFNQKSILIITFNQKQAMILENNFVETFINTPLYEKYLNKSLMIKSLENVQGEEADIVILSISYAKDKTNKVRNFFGPLSQSGGANRLNVAITRAREKMIVVKSIKASDIKVSDNQNNLIFKEYLNYLETKHGSTIFNYQPSDINEMFINDIYHQLNDSLDTNQFQIQKQKNIGKYTIDIAIIDRETKLVKLAIILNQNNSNEILDINRFINLEIFLENLGYKTISINILEWKNDYLKIVNYIKQMIKH